MKKSLDNNPFPTYEPDIFYHLGLSFANLEMFEDAIEPFTQVANCYYFSD